MIIEEAKSKEVYIRAWTEGMRHVHWFNEPKLFGYNPDEMVEELQRDFGKPGSAFLKAIARRSKKVIGVLGIRLEEEVGVLRRWEPAVPPRNRESGAGEALIEKGLEWLRHEGAEKAVCLLKYPYSSSETGDWHISLYERCGFRQTGPISVQMLADLEHRQTEPPLIPSNLVISTGREYTLDDFAEFTLKAYASTVEDRAIHGWDPLVSNREAVLKGLRSIKQGKYGSSPVECWIVATVDAEPAGFVVSFIPNDNFRPTYGVVGLIGVFPEFRGQGTAFTLVAEAHKCFRKHGCRYAYVGTPETNEGAISLYEKAGYKPVFEIANFERKLE